jgi:hypothetical protein
MRGGRLDLGDLPFAQQQRCRTRSLGIDRSHRRAGGQLAIGDDDVVVFQQRPLGELEVAQVML